LTGKESAISALDLERTYLGLDGKGAVRPLPVGPDFWETLDQNPAARGTLVTQGVSDGDWAHWEMHPKGDEVVYLLDGDVTMIFERRRGEERVRLTPRQAVVVPAGVWHRALVPVPSRLLFMTYGEGTQHKPLASAKK
jgi:mannose-6-phosphate isomerase-like protein (cupin superfamily)